MSRAEQISDLFTAWQTYPHSLALSALDTDANRCNARLHEDAERLFIPSGERCQLVVQDFVSQRG